MKLVVGTQDETRINPGNFENSPFVMHEMTGMGTSLSYVK